MSTVLTDDQIEECYSDKRHVFARAIEQAVLQSPEIRALRKDAERYRFMRSVENGAVLEAAIDAAMEKQP